MTKVSVRYYLFLKFYEEVPIGSFDLFGNVFFMNSYTDVKIFTYNLLEPSPLFLLRDLNSFMRGHFQIEQKGEVI